MADTGRCAVLDVSEVPKERPTGHNDNNDDDDDDGDDKWRIGSLNERVNWKEIAGTMG